MRLSVLPLLLAGASVVGLVAAEPIRVIDTANANIRFGHALANANVNGNDDNVARIVRPMTPIDPSSSQGKGKGLARHFCGASLREKALRLSNTFRHALGLPLVEANLEVGRVHILPVGYPNAIVHQEDLDEEGKPKNHHGHHGVHGHHGHHHRHHQKTFLRRIHRAIKALGPWEGRAVAFVLGCGIGVLMRMFWVLSVLAYRTVRGEREEPFDREYFVYEQVPAETLFVAPPQYIDEKVNVEASGDIKERE